MSAPDDPRVRTLRVGEMEVDFGRWITLAEAVKWAARYREAMSAFDGTVER